MKIHVQHTTSIGFYYFQHLHIQIGSDISAFGVVFEVRRTTRISQILVALVLVLVVAGVVFFINQDEVHDGSKMRKT